MLLKTCALIALIAFAQIVRAQDEVEEAKPAVKHQEDEEEAKLEDRGGLYGNNKRERNGEGGREGGRGEYRGNGGGNLLNANRGRNIEGSDVRISNLGVTNKQVPGTVRVAPTTRTQSRRQRVVKSRKNEYYQQNSASTVVQNNVVKKTNIHVNTDTTIHVPETVKTFVKKHHTKYVINTQPIQTFVNIERKQDIYKPQLKNIVIYKNSESIQRNRLRTITRQKGGFERLKTIWEPTHNEGTRVIGNPLQPGAVSKSLGFSGGLASNLGSGLSSLNNERNYKSGKRGGSYQRHNSYGLNKRTDVAQNDEEEIVVQPAATEEKKE